MQKLVSGLNFTCANDLFASAKLSPRRGTLQWLKTNQTIQTPACLTYTIRGAVPHLVHDNLIDLPIDGYHLSFEHFLAAKEPASIKYNHGIHKYVHLENQVIFCDTRDPQKMPLKSFNTDNHLSVNTHSGLRPMTLELWGKLVQAYRPDAVAAMADLVCDKEAKMKRIVRSVDRSLHWLDECVLKAKETNTPLFAPIMGHTSPEERQRSSIETAKRHVDGYIISVLGLDSENFASLLKSSLAPLPFGKPTLAYGLDSPEHILLGVANGIDLFGGSYAYNMTERGRAITMKFGKPTVDDKTINMWDTRFAQTFEPLDTSCQCPTCTAPHTKAYIHHLLKAHEMLGTILLMRHNIYQLGQFMSAIRQSIERHTFKQDMDIFMDRYNHADDGQGDVSSLGVASLGMAIKKKRTLT